MLSDIPGSAQQIMANLLIYLHYFKGSVDAEEMVIVAAAKFKD
jgi:hypothetical protein